MVASGGTFSIDAILPIGIVLAEAIVLYVGYGALTRAVGPTVRETISG